MHRCSTKDSCACAGAVQRFHAHAQVQHEGSMRECGAGQSLAVVQRVGMHTHPPTVCQPRPHWTQANYTGEQLLSALLVLSFVIITPSCLSQGP